MRKIFAIAALALSLAGCVTTSQIQQQTAAIGQLNTALIQLNATVIQNTAALAQQLMAVECPIINATVTLGMAINASPGVANSVKKVLTKAGPVGTTAAAVCVAAGFTSSTLTTSVPPGVPVITSP